VTGSAETAPAGCMVPTDARIISAAYELSIATPRSRA
jgi:hypothetical protein